MQVFVPRAWRDAAREDRCRLFALRDEQRVEAVISSEVAPTGGHQRGMALVVRIDEQYPVIRRACLSELLDHPKCNVGGGSRFAHATLVIRHDEYASHCPTLR